MRRLFIFLAWLACLGIAMPCLGATGRVFKVLPHNLDLQGRHTLSPSLYERDAYQAYLRENPSKSSGLRFDVQWKSKGQPGQPLKLRLELRGIARGGDLPEQRTIERMVQPTGWFSRWTGLPLLGEEYKQFGQVTAWRVSLLEGDQVLGEQKSFLW